MLSHKESEIEKQDWSEIRSNSVVIPMKDFGELKKYYLKVLK